MMNRTDYYQLMLSKKDELLFFFLIMIVSIQLAKSRNTSDRDSWRCNKVYSYGLRLHNISISRYGLIKVLFTNKFTNTDANPCQTISCTLIPCVNVSINTQMRQQSYLQMSENQTTNTIQVAINKHDKS